MPRTSKKIIPVAVCSRILREKIEMSGHRISDSAAEYLADILEKVGIEIGNSAFYLMTHTGRKTMKKIDVEIAHRMLLPKIMKIIEEEPEDGVSEDGDDEEGENAQQ